MSAMRLAIVGAGGRMGRTLTRLIHESGDLEVAGGTERHGSEFVGKDLGTLAGVGPINALAGNKHKQHKRIPGKIEKQKYKIQFRS